MAKIYFDANIFISLIEKRKEIALEQFNDHQLLISPLSIHILNYLYKYKIPEDKLSNIEKIWRIVPLDNPITSDALQGPTDDFEDNVQLHSAAHAECDIFLTEDIKLLAMRFFGKTRITKDLLSSL